MAQVFRQSRDCLSWKAQVSPAHIPTLEDLRQLRSFNPLSNQSDDPPHFSVNPTSEGFESLSSAVDENKAHFDQIVDSKEKGGVRTSALKNKKGEVIGVKFERGNNTAEGQKQFNKLIVDLIKNSN